MSRPIGFSRKMCLPAPGRRERLRQVRGVRRREDDGVDVLAGRACPRRTAMCSTPYFSARPGARVPTATPTNRVLVVSPRGRSRTRPPSAPNRRSRTRRSRSPPPLPLARAGSRVRGRWPHGPAVAVAGSRADRQSHARPMATIPIRDGRWWAFAVGVRADAGGAMRAVRQSRARPAVACAAGFRPTACSVAGFRFRPTACSAAGFRPTASSSVVGALRTP